MNKELIKESPFFVRYFAYLKERFPLIKHGILILSYYSSNQFLAQVLENSRSGVHYNLNSLSGAIIILCMFYHLRVFDEHKDYADDCKFYPQRILSKGIITLKELKITGIIAISLELVISYLLGPAVFLAVIITIGFSFLMLKEFFISDWLKKNFFIYAISHMLIMPMFALVIFSVTTGKFFYEADSLFYLYSFVGFFVTFNWEVSRKIRAPEDEIDGVSTYSQIFGVYGAAYLVIIIRVIDTAMVSIVGYFLGLSLWFYLVLTALFLVCLTGLFQFRFNTNRKTAQMMETYAGLYIIAFDLTLAFELMHTYSFKLI
jgi:hypothetical protein